MIIADEKVFPMEYFSIPPQYKDYLASVLLPHGMIGDRVEKIARDIVEDYPHSTPHLLVVLKGGSEFATDLTRVLRRIHSFTPYKHIPFTVDYVRVKSYAGTESSGEVQISGIDMKTLVGRDVILVEDIIDTGNTMMALLPMLKKFGPKTVRVTALLEKRTHKSCGFKADYVGFSVPDAFVVGYNLDYNEAFRDMPHICIINKAGIDHFKSHPLVSGAFLGSMPSPRRRKLSQPVLPTPLPFYTSLSLSLCFSLHAPLPPRTARGPQLASFGRNWVVMLAVCKRIYIKTTQVKINLLKLCIHFHVDKRTNVIKQLLLDRKQG